MATKHYVGAAAADAQRSLPSRARARKALGDRRPPRRSLAARRDHRLKGFRVSLCQVAKPAFILSTDFLKRIIRRAASSQAQQRDLDLGGLGSNTLSAPARVNKPLSIGLHICKMGNS